MIPSEPAAGLAESGVGPVSPSPSLSIRKATEADAEPLASFGARTFLDAYGGKAVEADLREYVDLHFTPEEFRRDLGDPAFTFFLAEQGDRWIGYAVLHAGPAPDCVKGPRPIELARIYLDQAQIGQGFGAALLRVCLQEAARLGFETIWLGLWEENHRARAFYERTGFVLAGTHPFQFGSTLHADPVMARPLVSA